MHLVKACLGVGILGIPSGIYHTGIAVNYFYLCLWHQLFVMTYLNLGSEQLMRLEASENNVTYIKINIGQNCVAFGRIFNDLSLDARKLNQELFLFIFKQTFLMKKHQTYFFFH